MKSFRLVISSPDGDLFNGDAVKISLRGTEGDLAVMAGHVPFVTAVRECPCFVELEDGRILEGRTLGGLLTVGTDRTTLLSSSFSFVNENDK